MSICPVNISRKTHTSAAWAISITKSAINRHRQTRPAGNFMARYTTRLSTNASRNPTPRRRRISRRTTIPRRTIPPAADAIAVQQILDAAMIAADAADKAPEAQIVVATVAEIAAVIVAAADAGAGAVDDAAAAVAAVQETARATTLLRKMPDRAATFRHRNTLHRQVVAAKHAAVIAEMIAASNKAILNRRAATRAAVTRVVATVVVIAAAHRGAASRAAKARASAHRPRRMIRMKSRSCSPANRSPSIAKSPLPPRLPLSASRVTNNPRWP